MLQAIRRALISVSDKTGVVELAQSLHDNGVELLSTGGTAKLIAEQGIAVTEISAHTGFPEMMAGRVKTLHPKVHGGILGRRGIDDAVMQEHDIDPIDLVVINLYPFSKRSPTPTVVSRTRSKISISAGRQWYVPQRRIMPALP